jgi:HK97 family phage portal protein
MAFWDFLKKRQPAITTKPKKENLGASWDSPYGNKPVFPSRDALEAYGEHAYLYAAITRCTEDLSALPLKVIRGTGKDSIILDSHPVKDLLNNPSTMMDGYLFRQQITLDLILNGTFFILMIGAGKLPTSLIRLHPEETQFVTDKTIGIKGVKNSSYGQEVIYDIAKVLYGRNASYTKGPKSLYGTGVIQPLYEELKSDTNAMLLASQASAQGRPDILISPSDEADVWPKEVREEIISSYTKMAKKGGAIALSGMAKIETLNLSPREMEYKEARLMARQSISAAIGIPPTILGIPDANYATSLNQRKTYWVNQQHRARKLEIVYTKLAKLWSDDLRVVHDFNHIDALSDRDKALERIQKHIQNGMKPQDAYAYEGLEDAPEVKPVFRPVEVEPVKEPPLDDEKKNSAFIEAVVKNQEQERANIWQSWVETKQAPAENLLINASSSFMSDIKRHIFSRIDQKKTLGLIYNIKSNPDELLTEDNFTRIAQDNFEEPFVEIYEKNYREESNRLRDLIGAGALVGLISNVKPLTFLGLMTTQIYKTTIEGLRQFFIGLETTLAPDDLKKELEKIPALSTSRVITISRTESTKLVNAATTDAAVDLENEPDKKVRFIKEWITERDDKVRPAHQALDGQTVDVYNLFEVPHGDHQGAKANWPTGFNDVGLNINCRCSTISRPVYD